MAVIPCVTCIVAGFMLIKQTGYHNAGIFLLMSGVALSVLGLMVVANA